jgi:hypothetical protein
MQNLIECKICKNKLDPHKYYFHLLKVHSVTNIESDKRTKTIKNKLTTKEKMAIYQKKLEKSMSNPKNSAATTNKIPRKPRTIDGSKGFEVVREGGRYGSFPSFDPNEDE